MGNRILFPCYSIGVDDHDIDTNSVGTTLKAHSYSPAVILPEPLLSVVSLLLSPIIQRRRARRC